MPPSKELIAMMFKILVDHKCVWLSVKYLGIQKVQLNNKPFDAYCVSGVTHKDEKIVVVQPLGTDNIIVLGIK